MTRVVVIGSIALDRQTRPDDSHAWQFGGVATYGGLTFARHGLDVTLIANLAHRETDAVRDFFDENGVRTRLGPSPDTTVFRNMIDTDERRPALLAAARPVERSQVVEVVGPDDHVHLGIMHAEDVASEVLAWVAERPGPVSLDLQGLVRRPGLGLIVPRVSDDLAAALHGTAVLKAEDAEMKRVLEAWHVSLAELVREFDLDEVLVTRGERGGLIATADGVVHEYAAAPVDDFRHDVGAGDVFFAAYLAARWHDNQSIADAATHAAGIASRQVEDAYIEAASILLPEDEQSRLPDFATARLRG